MYCEIEYYDPNIEDNGFMGGWRESGACGDPNDPEWRKFLHDSLDEYLDGAVGSKNFTDRSKFLVKRCTVHDHTPPPDPDSPRNRQLRADADSRRRENAMLVRSELNPYNDQEG